MKVVGLLSGGKDSIFNLVHCVAHNHQPVVLASLGPPPNLPNEELDSYMYQTVGHSALDFIAEAMEVPLVRGVIKGTAVEMGGEYGSREGKKKAEGSVGDETEDLFDLLSRVKAEFPQVEAVSVGAILSNYQRVRVEHVCSRLGLSTLAFLWERDQRSLLSEMVQAGMGSVLIKVAGAGLGVEHLGKSLSEMELTLHRLNARYQLHICGEGGEYESFTLDCPLFTRRIVLDKPTITISNSDPYSTVAHLHLDELSLVPKDDISVGESFSIKQARIRDVLTIPNVLDEEGSSLRDAIAEAIGENVEAGDVGDIEVGKLSLRDQKGEVEETSVKERNGWVAFANVVSSSEDLALEDEVRNCFGRLSELLSATHSLSLLSLAHLTVYLSASSMALFPAINAVYASHFGSSPPTRACVSIAHIPGRRKIMLEGWARKDGPNPCSRTSLHVQSMSYWAAANIGPYSQSIATADRLFVAGQIGLIPCSLTLPSPTSFQSEAAISLQHLRRIVAASENGRWKGATEGGICWLSTGKAGGTAEWIRRVRGARLAAVEAHAGPVAFVKAACLPKGAAIEWQITFAREPEEVDSDDEEGLASLSARQGGRAVGIVAVKSVHDHPAKVTEEVLLVKAFYPPHLDLSQVKAVAMVVFGTSLPPTTFIESEHLSTMDEDSVDVVFVYG